MNGKLGRRLRFGLIGGGPGAFIGGVHVIAATMDGRAEIAAGAFSSNAAKSKAAAPGYGVDPSRAYGSYQEMIDAETKRGGDGIDFIICAAPNHVHAAACTDAWNAGLSVATDKPFSNNFTGTQDFFKLVQGSPAGKRRFHITYNYTMNPMALMAAEMVRNGDIGDVDRVESRYLQGWLRTRLELEADDVGGKKQAAWRTDPALAGAGAWGDIATHAYTQGIFVANVRPKTLTAKLRTRVAGRQLDDCGFASIECENGAHFTVEASQVAPGHLNDHTLSVHGTKRSLHWRQEEPDWLWVYENGEAKKRYDRRGGGFMTPTANSVCRLPGGHGEAYLPGFANGYRWFFDEVVEALTGERPNPKPAIPAPGIAHAYLGNHFIHKSQTSSAGGGIEVSMVDPAFSLLV